MSESGPSLEELIHKMDRLCNLVGYDAAARASMKSRFEAGGLTPDDEIALDVMSGIFEVVFREHNLLIALNDSTLVPVEQVLNRRSRPPA